MTIDLNKFERDTLCLHVATINPSHNTDGENSNPFIRLSYDLGNDFTDSQIAAIKGFVNEVNKRFADVKMFTTGTGYVPKKDKEESE